MKILLFMFLTSLLRAGDIGILVFDEVLTSDVVAPFEVFGMAKSKGFLPNQRVFLLGVEKDRKTIRTAEGLTLFIDRTIHDSLDLDILIVSGAYDVTNLKSNKNLKKFLKAQEKSLKYLSSNCAGAFVLAEHGYLDGYKATTWIGGEDLLQKQYKKILVQKDVGVIIDRNRITSNGGIVSYESAISILKRILPDKKVNEVYNFLSISRYKKYSEIK